MPLLIVAATIAFFGAIGGVFNAIIIDGGFLTGGWLSAPGRKIWSLGFSSNILCGAFASFVSWGLYGPLSSADLFQPNEPVLTLASICGAALTGFSGASWLTTQANKNSWKTTAIAAIQAPASLEAAAQIATKTPETAFKIVQDLRESSS